MTFIHNHQKAENWRCYPKWTKKGCYGVQNVGDVPGLANKWLNLQGQHADKKQTPFDRNSGRKSLARWLEYLRIPYQESINIHGDLEDVWRHSYQGQLSKSNYRVREQATDPDTATKALRKLVKWFNQDGEPEVSVKEQLKNGGIVGVILTYSGQYYLKNLMVEKFK